MKKEKNNFTRVIEWLRENGIIRNQKDMAEQMDITQTTISRNKHGDVKRPDEDTLRKFKAAFGEIINIAYLRGESNIMLVKDLLISDVDLCKSSDTIPDESQLGSADSPTPSTATGMDASKDETIAAKDETISAKDETIAVLRSQLADKDEIIALLRSQLADKESLVNDKDALITSLQQQVIELREKLTLEKREFDVRK